MVNASAALEAVGEPNRADQLLMASNRKAIGHSGDEVADGAQLLDVAAAAAPGVGQQRRIRAVCGSQVGDDPLGFLADLLELGRLIEPRIEEALQTALLRFEIGRKSDQRTPGGADV